MWPGAVFRDGFGKFANSGKNARGDTKCPRAASFFQLLPNPISCHPRSGAELVRFRNADTRPQAGATGDVLAVHSVNAGGVTIGNRQGIANQGTSAIAFESKRGVEASSAQVRIVRDRHVEHRDVTLNEQPNARADVVVDERATSDRERRARQRDATTRTRICVGATVPADNVRSIDLRSGRSAKRQSYGRVAGNGGNRIVSIGVDRRDQGNG